MICKASTLLLLLITLGPLYLSSFVVSAEDDDVVDQTTIVNNLVEWFRSHGGYLNPKVEFRRFNPDDPQSSLGLFATDFIPKGTKLIEVPRSVMIVGGPYLPVDNTIAKVQLEDGTVDEVQGVIIAVHIEEDGSETFDIFVDDWGDEGDLEETFYRVKKDNLESIDVDCGAVRRIVNEIKLGKESEIYPFMRYLQTKPKSELPDAWSEAGQEYFTELIGQSDGDDNDDEDIPLPPFQWAGKFEEEWVENCNGNANDELEKHVYYLVVTRGWDEIVVPVYDMLNHRNGKWFNTDSDHKALHNDTEANIDVIAIQDIQAGGQLFTSYNLCADCGGRYSGYGTENMLRDYGFVEDYPQRWIFEAVNFDLDYDDENEGELKVTWIETGVPREKEIKWMEMQLNRLQSLEETYTAPEPLVKIPPAEWFVITKYYAALVQALSSAIKKARQAPARFVNDEL